MPESTKVQDLLRAARQRAGLTQGQVADRAGLQQSVISTYESGRRQPSVPMLQRLLRATGFDLDLVLRPSRPLPDDVRNGEVLVQVLDLADVLPHRRPGPLRYPPLRAP